jgi:hypothetical protein
MDELKLVSKEGAWCEHCGDLEPFTVMFDDGGTKWCLDCAKYDREFCEEFTAGDIKEAKLVAIDKKIEYFNKRTAQCLAERRRLSDGE